MSSTIESPKDKPAPPASGWFEWATDGPTGHLHRGVRLAAITFWASGSDGNTYVTVRGLKGPLSLPPEVASELLFALGKFR